MQSISAVLTEDHHQCDSRFAELETAVSKGDWEAAAGLLERFDAAMRRHIDFEEQVLFPALETSGAPAGPAEVMRMEHEQMRELLDALGRAAAGNDAEDLLGAAETLLVLIQQHNVKEEQILYHLADELLPEERRQEVMLAAAEWGIA